jgi:hypothetical protein
VSADALIEALCEQNGVSRAPRLPPNPRLNERSVSWPATFEVSDVLLKGAIEQESDICLVSPTLKHEYLETLTLSALFKLMKERDERTRALVLTADPNVRERFKHLRPGHRREWSKAEFPIATVQSDGSVKQKTLSWADDDREPRALFSRHLHYLPDSEVSREIGCVIYDASVNFKHDRWEAFHEWREDNAVPTVAYCLRDPLGPEYRNVSDETSVWSWPPALLEAVLPDDYLRSATDGGATKRKVRMQRQLANKVEGINREVHPIIDGELVASFNEVWEYIEDLQEIHRRVGSEELDRAVRDLKTALNVLSNVVASMNFTTQAYREEWESLTQANWFDRLDHRREQMLEDSQAKQAVGPYRNACTVLEQAYESWSDFNISEKKQGHLYRLLYGSLNEGESVTVVVPKDSDKKAVNLDLQQRGGDLYEALGDQLQFATPDAFTEAPTCDRVIISGPPRWSHRWVLRTPHAPAVTFLAYEHQLPLLDYQLHTLNEALADMTDRPVYRHAVAAASGGSGTSDSTSLVAHVDVEAPEVDAETESGIAEGYEIVEEHEPTSVDEIIGEMSQRSGAVGRDTRSDRNRGSRSDGPVSCIRLCFDDGREMPVRPGKTLYAIDTNDGGITRRPVGKVEPGHRLVTIRQTQNLREQLYNLIKRKGDDRLIMQAELWKIKLKQALEANDDDLDDFIDRLEEEGADHRRRTYRSWYNLEVDYTRDYDDMKRIARAYELTVVEEELEDIWDAAQQIKSTYQKLLRELRKRAYRAMVGEEQGEVMISEEHDIRLSDIDTYDDRGNSLVERHTVVDTHEDEASPHRLGSIMSADRG